MVALAAASAVIDALSSAVTPDSTATPPVTASQQSSWDQALATAQLGMTDTDSGTSTEDAAHLVLFSMWQNSVMHAMDNVERTRQEASQDDD